MDRKYYIDNIRILLTALVVLHHLAITYACGPGLWYYIEPNPNPIANLLLTLFIATNQSFFMGMFFLISAYFLEKSLRRKTVNQVVNDKLKRRGKDEKETQKPQPSLQSQSSPRSRQRRKNLA